MANYGRCNYCAFFRLELTVSISYENMLNSEQHETPTTLESYLIQTKYFRQEIILKIKHLFSEHFLTL